MTIQQRRFTPEQIVTFLGDIRAPFIESEIRGTAFKPSRHPLYLEYAMELLRLMLPVAALEKAYVGSSLDHKHDLPDHLVCNRTVNLMTSMVDKALYERFKDTHPRMPKQLTAKEWPDYMLQMRFHGWHSGVPVYPSADSALDLARPLDFITEQQCAMARASLIGIPLIERDPFEVALEFQGSYPHTSAAALVLVITKAQSKLRVLHVVHTARGPVGPHTFHATPEQAEEGVDAAAAHLQMTLTLAERECAIQALHLAQPAAIAA